MATSFLLAAGLKRDWLAIPTEDRLGSPVEPVEQKLDAAAELSSAMSFRPTFPAILHSEFDWPLFCVGCCGGPTSQLLISIALFSTITTFNVFPAA